MPLARSQPSLLHSLRESTQPVHRSLEVALPLMRNDLSVAVYIAILRRFYSLHEPLERQLLSQADALADLGIDIAARSKTAWLRTDLTSLEGTGMPPMPSEADGLPKIRTVWQAMGCLYVTEGATLGGRIIARHLRQHLGIDALNGARFFSSYANRTGTMWKQYLAGLSQCPYKQGSVRGAGPERQVIEAASALFTTFHRHLTSDRTP